MFIGKKLCDLKKQGNRYYCNGKWWTLNRPVKHGRHMAVLASKTLWGKRRAKVVHFTPMKQKGKGAAPTSNRWSSRYWAHKAAQVAKKAPVKLHRKKAQTRRRTRKAA